MQTITLTAVEFKLLNVISKIGKDRSHQLVDSFFAEEQEESFPVLSPRAQLLEKTFPILKSGRKADPNSKRSQIFNAAKSAIEQGHKNAGTIIPFVQKTLGFDSGTIRSNLYGDKRIIRNKTGWSTNV